jgi:hypothetical protein
VLLVVGRAGNEPAQPRRRARAGAGQGVSMQDDQGDDSALGSLAAIRSGIPSFETLSAVPSSRNETF